MALKKNYSGSDNRLPEPSIGIGADKQNHTPVEDVDATQAMPVAEKESLRQDPDITDSDLTGLDEDGYPFGLGNYDSHNHSDSGLTRAELKRQRKEAKEEQRQNQEPEYPENYGNDDPYYHDELVEEDERIAHENDLKEEKPRNYSNRWASTQAVPQYDGSDDDNYISYEPPAQPQTYPNYAAEPSATAADIGHNDSNRRDNGISSAFIVGIALLATILGSIMGMVYWNKAHPTPAAPAPVTSTATSTVTSTPPPSTITSTAPVQTETKTENNTTTAPPSTVTSTTTAPPSTSTTTVTQQAPAASSTAP